jgi:hypothetical protein
MDGTRLAGLMADELKTQFSLDTIPAMADDNYLVMQTGCPAVVAYVPPGKTQSRITQARCRKQAYALYNALVRFYGVDPAPLYDFQYVVVGKDHQRLTGALVTMDGFLTLETENDGLCHFRLLGKGEHMLRVRLGEKNLGTEKLFLPVE